MTLNGLGNVALIRGDLSTAQVHYERSLAIKEKLDPGSLHVAGTLNNLGELARRRQHLAVAEDYYRRDLAITEKVTPDSLDVATSFNNLGLIAVARGDLAAAQVYLQRSLAIREKLDPDGFFVATSLTNLGIIAWHRDDFVAAEEYFLRALAITQKIAPESLHVAPSLNNLGGVAGARGDLEAAEDYYERALAISQKLVPGSLEESTDLHDLGQTARRRGNLLVAAGHLRRALSTRSALAPGSWMLAETLYEMAKVHEALKQPSEALEFLRRSLTSLEAQSERLGGGRQSRESFLARYGVYYRDTVRSLVRTDKGAEAFHVLERSRVRGLLAMLAERDLVFATDLTEELRLERLEANAEHDTVLDQLGSWNALQDEPDAKRAELRRQLERARVRQQEVQAKIRSEFPQFAALQYPDPLTLAETQEALDPGTLLLAYSLGEDESFVFLVGRGEHEFAVLRLDITIEQARDLVAGFRDMWQPGGRRDAWVRLRAAELGKRLLAPATAQIAAAERLMILPDGPLYYLSFAALGDPGSGEAFHYLIESKPVSVVASATLFAQLKQQRKSRTGAQVAAFADPVFRQGVSEQTTEEPVLRSVVRRGFAFPALPGTRVEAAAIARLYPESSTIYLGDDAREDTAKSIGKGPSIIHFATHGLVDDRHPLSSALAFSIPETWERGQDNGLLQAWEIFEEVRLDADLVTLSGCETALGKDGGGEGLLGLTRAFQYAGARTVLASLWKVSDASTAALMEHFYGHLRSGKTKDQALREAQLDLLAGPVEVGVGEDRLQRDYRHPFYWAPFQVIGDWY